MAAQSISEKVSEELLLFSSASWEQWSAGTLFATPPNRTKYYARLDLAWVEPIVGFYNPSFV
ncbi:MAG TPA: hypothetical protein PLJ29_12475, partial [Leptospiraceae bacterium]|nr:hypothetical protein [Leptospiraceae bacterium]